jgi:hypothetical protein
MSDKDEIAELKARVVELEAKAKPPEPFRPEPYQRFDPTARMSMPRSALQEMVNVVPDPVLRGIVRDNQAPQGPSSAGAIPSSQQISNVRGAGGGSGWAREVPLSPPPGVAQADRLMDVQDAKDRQDRIVQEAQRQALLKAGSKQP